VVIQRVIAGHQLGLVGVDDRQNAVRHRVERGLAVDAIPVFEFFFEKRYLAFGNVGTQRPFSMRVFQPT
jgi:hypothetical protein